jgi:hypothetical protein
MIWITLWSIWQTDRIIIITTNCLTDSKIMTILIANQPKIMKLLVVVEDTKASTRPTSRRWRDKTTNTVHPLSIDSITNPSRPMLANLCQLNPSIIIIGPIILKLPRRLLLLMSRRKYHLCRIIVLCIRISKLKWLIRHQPEIIAQDYRLCYRVHGWRDHLEVRIIWVRVDLNINVRSHKDLSMMHPNWRLKLISLRDRENSINCYHNHLFQSIRVQ